MSNLGKMQYHDCGQYLQDLTLAHFLKEAMQLLMVQHAVGKGAQLATRTHLT